MTRNSALVSVTKKPEESAVEVRAEIPTEALARYRAKALRELGSEVSIDGFRKGHIPESVLVKHKGEAAIWERLASIAVSEEVPEILARENIIAIETAKVTITKLAPGNPLAFTALVTVMPEVKLPDYKSLAKKHNASLEKAAVSDDEHAEMLRFLRRERARIEAIEKGASPETAHEDAHKREEKDLPELDDAFAQSLGAADTEELSARMRANMQNDKERKAYEKVRIATIEAILEKTPMILPNILIEHELNRMLDRLAHDIQHAGGTFEAYLKETKKTPEDLRKEWRASAEKRAKVQIIVHEIAMKENIRPDTTAVAHEMEHLKEHYPAVAETRLRMHVEEALLPDAVFTWLEDQK